VAEDQGASYNPLFIYGDVGLGKTHLLHAIAHVALSSNLKVVYVSAEQFTNEFINAIRMRKTEEFRNKYRGVDMLLIDDIHFISGKEQTQEGFFHTFNDLHNANRQIAITSDQPPKSMSLLEDRLRSRFEWGLIADIQPPDLETRLAILRSRAEQQGLIISQEVLEFIARRFEQNIRELEGSLNRIAAYARLTRASLTLELAAQALGDGATQATPCPTITPAMVTEVVARCFDIAPEELRGKKREQKIALARQIAMYLMREETHISLAQIGKELGGRDYSTVLHGYRKIVGGVEESPQLRRQLSQAREILHPA
jgi:chromosomal replication initiator protein